VSAAEGETVVAAVVAAVGGAEGADEAAEPGDAFGVPLVDVPAASWVAALTAARDAGCTYFDWLSAVDEGEEGFSVVAHLAAVPPYAHLLVRTRVPRDAARLPTATGVFRGASWHERETHEMFGVGFDGHPNLVPLLLPEAFEGHPLRKEFVLAARAAKPWPGAKEPGESEAGAAASPSRRRTRPPGVPDPEEWGPRPPE
jgi:NADH-quinone oxidoreductase subunit C